MIKCRIIIGFDTNLGWFLIVISLLLTLRRKWLLEEMILSLEWIAAIKCQFGNAEDCGVKAKAYKIGVF